MILSGPYTDSNGLRIVMGWMLAGPFREPRGQHA